MESFAAFLERNWAVIKNAPATFILFGALALLGGFALASQNSRDLIATLQERIKLKDDQLAKDSTAWQQEFLKKRQSANFTEKPPIMVGREYDTLYQEGKKVGEPLTPPTLSGLHGVEFQSLRVTKDFNPDKPFEYNDLILEVTKGGFRLDRPDEYTALCSIIGHRS